MRCVSASRSVHKSTTSNKTGTTLSKPSSSSSSSSDEEEKKVAQEEPTGDKQKQSEAKQAEQHQQPQQEEKGQQDAVDAPPRRRMDNTDQIWLDTLAWLDRGEVGSNIALVNARFATLVDKQLQQRHWWLEELHICEQQPKGTGAEAMSLNSDGSYYSLPLATVPLPENVVGFNSTFNIWYFDAEVIIFLHRMRRLFTTDISLQFSIRMTEYRAWKAMARYIWPLMKNGIIILVNLKRKQLSMMRKHVSPTVLSDCPNLVQITSSVLPERPTADDTFSADLSGRDLYMWLHTPRPDGRPLVYKLSKWNMGWDKFVNEVFTSFITASVPVKYMVLATFDFNYTRRERMVNILTEEKLTLLSNAHPTSDGVVTFVKIVRCPAEFTESNVITWLRMPRVRKESHPNLVTIGFSDDEIGPMLSNSAASMSRNRSG
ncbi:hypothetical protein niasHS_004253 [Heterodera schachtii]|uniref:Uncharacterized protein n=1 Tax=Heterodera schachtii TaxID=97005 RepID=A0ABD2JKV6_HETSC